MFFLEEWYAMFFSDCTGFLPYCWLMFYTPPFCWQAIPPRCAALCVLPPSVQGALAFTRNPLLFFPPPVFFFRLDFSGSEFPASVSIGSSRFSARELIGLSSPTCAWVSCPQPSLHSPVPYQSQDRLTFLTRRVPPVLSGDPPLTLIPGR